MRYPLQIVYQAWFCLNLSTQDFFIMVARITFSKQNVKKTQLIKINPTNINRMMKQVHAIQSVEYTSLMIHRISL